MRGPSAAREARLAEAAARVRVVSPDPRLAGSLEPRLREWGLSVGIETDFARLTPSAARRERVDLVLLDARRCDEPLLAWLASLKRALPALEVVLLDLPGQVTSSIAAMRAGASAELSAPFDLAALRNLLEASLRRRSKRLREPRPSLLERFQRAMTAATFAQAGEFETARQLLAEGGRTERADPEEDERES
jgi:DNA-binding NtrC family response regulator